MNNKSASSQLDFYYTYVKNLVEILRNIRLEKYY